LNIISILIYYLGQRAIFFMISSKNSAEYINKTNLIPSTYAKKLDLLTYCKKDRKSKFLCDSRWCNTNLSARNREIIFELFEKFKSTRKNKLCIFISNDYKFAHLLDLEPLLKVQNFREFTILGDYPYEIDLKKWPLQLKFLQLTRYFIDPIDLESMCEFTYYRGSPHFVSAVMSHQFTPCNNSPQFTPYNNSPQFTPCNNSPQFTPCNNSPQFTPYNNSPQFTPYNNSPQFTPYNNSPQLKSIPRSDLSNSWRKVDSTKS
jgi:hypothetical protein